MIGLAMQAPQILSTRDLDVYEELSWSADRNRSDSTCGIIFPTAGENSAVWDVHAYCTLI